MSQIDLISPKKVMARLDIPSSTLYRWISEGKFPKPIKIGPRRTAFKMSDITAFIEGKEKKHGVSK